MLIKVNIESLIVSHSHMRRVRGVGITRGHLHMRKNIMIASVGSNAIGSGDIPAISRSLGG